MFTRTNRRPSRSTRWRRCSSERIRVTFSRLPPHRLARSACVTTDGTYAPFSGSLSSVGATSWSSRLATLPFRSRNSKSSTKASWAAPCRAGARTKRRLLECQGGSRSREIAEDPELAEELRAVERRVEHSLTAGREGSDLDAAFDQEEELRSGIALMEQVRVSTISSKRPRVGKAPNRRQRDAVEQRRRGHRPRNVGDLDRRHRHPGSVGQSADRILGPSKRTTGPARAEARRQRSRLLQLLVSPAAKAALLRDPCRSPLVLFVLLFFSRLRLNLLLRHPT